MARVILAESDEGLRRHLQRALATAGHEVDAMADGGAVLDRLQDGPADLLLTAIVMPGLDGLELARQASDLQPGLKLAFITGFAAVAVEVPPYGTSARRLAKPFHLRDLVAQVRLLLEPPASRSK